VIGVMDDYHYISMHEKIRPFVILPAYCKKSFGTYYLSLKIAGRNVPGTLKRIKAAWKNHSELPFVYFFIDESYDRLYRNEAYTQSIFRSFSFISIFIAVLGLFGLVIYNIEQRTKEIGIRKTFGATATQIVMLLSINFSKWILAGFIVAVPVSWWLMTVWLRGFAYKTPIPVWIFPVALALVILIAWLTTGFQSLKAALKSPVEALRYE
jgi:putative ABC transport system permease protein